MAILHKRQRFNRNAVASSRGSYVMHSHRRMLKENHSNEASLVMFTVVKNTTPVHYVKCWGKLIPVNAERAALYPEDMVVIK